MVLDVLAVDNFDFTRKIVKKILCEKLVKMLVFCPNWIFGQKFDFSNSVKGYDAKEKKATKISGHLFSSKKCLKIKDFNPCFLATFQELKNEWSESRNLSFEATYQILVCHYSKGVVCTWQKGRLGLPNGCESFQR